MELQDKNTVVTGAANGIGKAVAQEFHKQGARVVLADRDEKTSRLGGRTTQHQTTRFGFRRGV